MCVSLCVTVCSSVTVIHSCTRYNNTENTQPKLAIKGIRCPEVMSYWTQGEIFLLRCDHDNELISKNECDQLVGVLCEGTG